MNHCILMQNQRCKMSAKIFSKDSSSSLIPELIIRVREAANPLKIILFGYMARNKPDENSDIDILVVVPDNVHRRHTVQNIYRHLSGFGFATDVIVATVGDLERYKDNFSMIFHSALKEGREIYNAAK